MGESVNYHLKNKSKPLDISIPGQSPNPAICTWTVSSVVSSFLANKTLRMEMRERFGCCFFFWGGGKKTPGYVCQKGGGKNGWSSNKNLPNLDLRLFDAWKVFQKKILPKW